MTRSMGDAIHDDVAALAAVAGSLQLVAGYVTGSPDIVWTSSDWAQFPGLVQVTIDQGFTGSPVEAAVVRDVEAGAWTASAAVDVSGWTAARPTIYCDQSTLPSVLADGWQGDLWLAIVGWVPGDSLPSAPGCTIVAVQNQEDVAGAYDLSVVLDPTWPGGNTSMPLLINSASGNIYLLDGGRLHHVTDPPSVAIYQAAGVALTSPVDSGEEAQLLADFPPGNPAVTVNSTVPTLTITGTVAPEAAS
jgi:hypothetical protein